MSEITTQKPLTDSATTITIAKSRRADSEVKPLKLGVALLSIIALLCSALEIELIEQLDHLSRYMKFGEIALDAGCGVLLLLLIGVAWWLFALSLAGIMQFVWRKEGHLEFLVWRFGLAVPLAYLGFQVFDAIRLQLFPGWHPLRFASIWLAIVFTILLTLCLFRIHIRSLQQFCCTRLSAFAWLHIAIGVIVLCVLSFRGAYFFSDYVHPSKVVGKANLPDIYLITFDALRADGMSLYGYRRPTTPRLDLFAQRSYVFDYFFANANMTTPATTSIETGKLPWSHHLCQLGGFLRGQNRDQTLASLLKERGYYTAMISSNYLATPIQHRTLESYDATELIDSSGTSGAWMHLTNLIGTNIRHTLSSSLLRRFAVLRDQIDALLWSKRYPSPPEEVFSTARELLERKDISQPRFLWTHIYAPHDPYLPPPPYSRHFLSDSKLTRRYDFIGFRNTNLPSGASESELRARYDEMVLYGDHVVGDFIEWLETTGRFDNSIVIVSADHGESFDHNWYGHTGPYLYNGLIRVPLLIHLPGQTHSVHISQSAQQVDLLPTILDLVGGNVPGGIDGRSLKGLLEGEKLPETDVFSMNLEPNGIFRPISRGTVAIIDGEFKYIDQLAANHEELYRYKADQSEEHNLIESEPEVAKEMHERLFKKLRSVSPQQ